MYKSIDYPLVGGKVSVLIEDIEGFYLEAISDDVIKESLKLQKIFNLYDPESELNQLNKKRHINASKELLDVITKALEYGKTTKGGLDISIGRNIIEQKKGYPLSQLGCSYKNIKIAGNKITLTHQDAIIDLGCIAKGYIADKLKTLLLELGVENALINLRGDLIVFGEKPEAIRIQHPRDESRYLATILVKNRAVATSGDYKQFISDHESCHIVGKKDFVSVTVIADSLMEADALATSIITMKKEDVSEFLKKHPTKKVFAVDAEMNIHLYNNFSEVLLEDRIKI